MDKNKIKNIALGVSLGVNIILGFFLGGGLISSCTAKKPVEASTSLASDAVEELAAPSKVRAVKGLNSESSEFDPNDYTNLWTYDAPIYTNAAGANIINWDATQQAVQLAPNGRVNANRLTRSGLYWFSYKHSGSDWGNAYVVDQANYETIMTANANNTFFQCVKRLDPGTYFYVSKSQLDSGRLYVVIGQQFYQDALVDLFLIDGAQLPASDRVVFPRNFFPWQIWGNRATDIMIGGPAVTSGTLAETQSLTFSKLLFRCNGRTYKGITLIFSYRPGQKLGRYDPTGEIFANGSIVYSSSNPPWYLEKMLYLPAESGVDWDIVLTANYAQLGDATLLMPNPVWSKDVYRTIDILDASAASMTGVPSGVGTNTPMEWLNIIAAAESIAPISAAGDPFSMLGNGFAAVGNILSIPILPFMTLGTLIAVPLIVLVILAILRLLAK